MVHVKLREDDPGPNIRLLYLNDLPVGLGSANRRDDVLLVQFFLNALWGKSPDKKTVIGDFGPAAGDRAHHHRRHRDIPKMVLEAAKLHGRARGHPSARTAIGTAPQSSVHNYRP